MTSVGIAQTMSSSRPENAQSGKYVARVLVARNHQANPSVAMTTGTTIASMIASESMRIRRSDAPIGPRGSRTPSQPHVVSIRAPRAANRADREAVRNGAGVIAIGAILTGRVVWSMLQASPCQATSTTLHLSCSNEQSNQESQCRRLHSWQDQRSRPYIKPQFMPRRRALRAIGDAGVAPGRHVRPSV